MLFLHSILFFMENDILFAKSFHEIYNGARSVSKMQCGAKCFLVEVELNGEKKVVPVKARTSVLARKTVRVQYEDAVKILSVKEEK